METIARTFIIPSGQNQFIQENVLNNAPIRRVAIAMNTNSAFTGQFQENPFIIRNLVCETRSETKAAVAERAIRSLKNIIYRYMEENGDKYVHKMDSFVNTMNTRVNRSIGKSPKNVKNSDFLSIFYKNPIIEYKKPRFKIGDKVRISKYDIPFRKGYKSQFTSEIFEIIKIATLKPPTYNLHGAQGDEILGKFYEQELAKCII